ncbi:ABC transporter ATP-binding protein [Pseudomonas sp. LJDD11]|uniref:ABC transporter ATP-binding protein n=2 Tax=Pseudomonadota TaxID=1224 RepID=UPI00211B990D|nr:ABC transporter ATP-binding protein [Pseudomonas sp. LJDD11]MCQ9424323.1 ABC transporter ATP-binding protein [Pseudomonas sp. LJDD11]
MSEPIIELASIAKMYRIFRSPRHRMIEALGLPVARSAYDEFWATRNLTLTINPGERVGLIGRNGAGKSTLLKLIAGLIQPTEGHLNVRGKVQALMELGTGFHPEFTGRANVLSSLAYQGVTGARARKLLEDVLDFAELDEFIDKPVKTYSSGMYSRLAFAAATAVRPEILIIDEILGAGDAYFAGKSAKRMRALTAEGSTVLFVSHDMSAVQMICDRAIWIERGCIVADGDPIEIGRAYAASIRKQQELRLRAINLKLSRGELSELLTDSDQHRVSILRLISANDTAPVSPLAVYEVRLERHAELIERVRVGEALDDDRSQCVHLLTAQGYTNWGPPKRDVNGLGFREFKDCGGQFRHAPISIKVPLGLGELAEYSVTIRHRGAAAGENLYLQIFDGLEYVTLGSVSPADEAGQVISQRFELSAPALVLVDADAGVPSKRSEFEYGEGSAWIDGVDFVDQEQVSRCIFSFGKCLDVNIRWGARADIPTMAFIVCIYGMDGRCISQVLSPFVAATPEHRSGLVKARFDPLLIGAGDYVISIGIFDGMTPGHALGAKPLDVQDRMYRIRVVAPEDERMERGIVVHPVDWNSQEASQ